MKQAPLVLLVLATFLAPIIGGQVYIGTQMLEGSFFEALRSAALPLSAHAVLSILVLAAFGIQVAVRKVVPLPNPTITLSLVAMVVAFGLASAISAFKWVSWTHWLEWIGYAFALLAVVAIVGRERGPRAVLWAIIAGCSLTSLFGITEYASMRSTDPSWRIFAHWINPNALAGMLLIGFVLALGMAVSEEDRLHKIIAGFAAIAIGFAILLTQSKGGYLGVGVGVGSLIALQLWFGARRQLLALAAPILVVAVLAAGLRSNPPTSAGLARVEASGGTTEQSAGFRQLLWKGAIEMVKENPFGYGLGTYRYESARPGLTPQTQFTHQGWLQIAAETGVVGFIAWLAFAVAWLVTVLRGARRAPMERSIRLGAVIAAVLACATHNMVDSDWQHFGIGFTFFLLLGVGAQLAADGSLPELLPKPARMTALALPVTLGLALLHSATVESLKSSAYTLLAAGDSKGLSKLNEARMLAPGDGEAYGLLALATIGDRRALLEQAATLAPSTKNLRALANYLGSAIDERRIATPEEERRVLEKALQRDPNNLLALFNLAESYHLEHDGEGTTKWARRLIAVEKLPYFRVRALPQVIPTETYMVRFYLAYYVPQEEADQLRLEGVRGFAEYARVTVPLIRDMVRAGGRDYAGESPEEATRKLFIAEQHVSHLIERYRATGRNTAELEALAKDLLPPDFGPSK